MPISPEPQSLLEALSFWAEKTPDKIFIRSGKGSYSFAETQSIALNLAKFLAASSIAAGARICLLLPRTPELIFSFFAANLAGCLPAPINYLERPENIKKLILSVQPAVIIVDAGVVSPEVLAFVKECGALVVAAGSRPPAQFLSWEHCLQLKLKAALPPRPGLHDTAYLNFTTGSTGFPKAALCTHANLYWNSRSAAEVFQLTDADVHLCMFASFAHPHELFCRALYTGGSLALLTEISPKAVIRAISRFHVTCMMGLAVLYKMMADHCRGMALPSLRIAESGGMFTAPQLQQDFQAAFRLPILSVWGSTETAGIALANSPAACRSDGSMGRVCPHYQVKLVDEEGNEVQPGEIGEMLVAGPAVAAGYRGDAPFPGRQGWYCSGDLARCDQDGFYYFAERRSGMIKVAGLKVYPLQIELALQQHPGISEAAVIGIEEKRHGSVPKAFVVAKDGVQLATEELIQFCRQRLAPYMVPKQFQFLASLPKIGSGKINKKALPAADSASI